ncbi:hypothetical protein KFK09_008411 [Dendrobium nobile]|uniref:Uncharacterized protein n=1 Tax=Dendrobium nobile TaxID=94219 RepID=A0A8T3BK26_DENNO|nr:hypothetical protein KFK09_008411 [Dendrobium nobile]
MRSQKLVGGLLHFGVKRRLQKNLAAKKKRRPSTLPLLPSSKPSSSQPESSSPLTHTSSIFSKQPPGLPSIPVIGFVQSPERNLLTQAKLFSLKRSSSRFTSV